MASDNRRVLLAVATPATGDPSDSFLLDFPSYGAHRLHAALHVAQLGAEIAVVDISQESAEALDELIERFRPDVLGCSAYVWSFPQLVDLARRTKQARPNCLVVFGGPSSTPSMFALPPYRSEQAYVDAIVVGEGDTALCEIVAAWPRSRDALRKIHGLYLPGTDGWEETPARTTLLPLDSMPSPYQLGLMPERRVAYVEGARGCPCECLFCGWSGKGKQARIMSREGLQRELEALNEHAIDRILLIDAGINLDRQAFQNLRDAERATNYLPGKILNCELYPTRVTPEHLEFLARARMSRVGVGVQSLNPEVLRMQHRPFVAAQLRELLVELAGIRTVRTDIELILGLPGDSPESFRRCLDTARSMPANVRVYQALALPGALMDRAPSELAIEFDPHSLIISSCAGWTEEDLWIERERLSELITHGTGSAGKFWWAFETAA